MAAKEKTGHQEIPHWRNADLDDPLSARAREINRQHLQIATMVAPAESQMVCDVASRIAVRLGVSEYDAYCYCDLGLMLRRFTKIEDVLQQGNFTFRHMSKIADDLAAVSDEHAAGVEEAVVAYLTARRVGQAIPGVIALHRQMQRIVEKIQPSARPTDPDEAPPSPAPDSESRAELTIDDRSQDSTFFGIHLPKCYAQELQAAIDSAAAVLECSRASALLALVRRQVQADITLHLYYNLANVIPDSRRIHMGSTWLSEMASAEWLNRVTHIALAGAGSNRGYAPTPSVRAAVIGRDGTCRFPGCEVPAEKCQLDHVHRYDSQSATGGPTSTANLHCLCQKHHNMKTTGQWDVTLHPDGHETWSSIGDGHTVRTEPNGPLGRETFAHKAEKRIRIRAERNQRRAQNEGGEGSLR